MTTNRQIVLDSLPEDKLTEANYRLLEGPVPPLEPGAVLCRTLAIQIAAGTRAALQGSFGYGAPPKTGMVMWGEGVARVTASDHPDFVTGDLVVARTGWQDYSVHAAEPLTKIRPALLTRCWSSRRPGYPGKQAAHHDRHPDLRPCGAL